MDYQGPRREGEGDEPFNSIAADRESVRVLHHHQA